MNPDDLTLDQKVAQLFMVGFEGREPNPITRRFLDLGVGGVIFFRDNFQWMDRPAQISALLEQVRNMVPAGLPGPFLGVDQEGGQVERLPHTLFPTALTPMAVALSSQPAPLAQDMYRQMARHLVQAGFNLDFFPTLDVNLEPDNPIIGVRSFGEKPETVWRLSKIAMDAFKAAGLVAVGKHFPGHGNGTVDSHLDLPCLRFTETELAPFRQAVTAGLPAMLVAHGYYPDLQDAAGEQGLPSSASPRIIRGLLRETLGFQGVIITDDMCMGAITRHRSPVEAALACLEAGVDMLLYKQSTGDEWAVYEAVREAFATGRLPASQLDEHVGRILALKDTLLRPAAQALPSDPEAEALPIAERGVSIRAWTPLPPLSPETRLLVIHPDRTGMGNYAFDVSTSPEFPAVLAAAGFRQVESRVYAVRTGELGSPLPVEPPEVILWVSFNPQLYAGQADLYAKMRQAYPGVVIWTISAGTAYESTVLGPQDTHLALCSYRPASMQALARFLLNTPP